MPDRRKRFIYQPGLRSAHPVFWTRVGHTALWRLPVWLRAAARRLIFCVIHR